jgi:hypothetical protein
MTAENVPIGPSGQAPSTCPESVPLHVPNVSRLSVANVPVGVPMPIGSRLPPILYPSPP